MENVKKEAKESNVLAIILIVLAIILFINPENFIRIAINVFGYLGIVWGIVLTFYYLRKINEENNNLAKGITLILFGVIAILKAQVLETVFTILLGGYLISQSARRINSSIILKVNHYKCWSYILEFSIINIVLSFLLYFKPIININSNIYMALIIIICEVILLIENIVILIGKKPKNI